jgi:hypothetical protein
VKRFLLRVGTTTAVVLTLAITSALSANEPVLAGVADTTSTSTTEPEAGAVEGDVSPEMLAEVSPTPHNYLRATDVPVAAQSPCADLAIAQAQEGLINPWLCTGDILTMTDPLTGAQTMYKVAPDKSLTPTTAAQVALEAEAAADADTADDPTDDPDALQTSAGDIQLSARVDDYHAVKNLYIAWGTAAGSGLLHYTYTIALYNHSATVKMGYIETTGKGVWMNWRLRIRHDINLGPDDTVFTYGDVMGPLTYRSTYSETEDRYGEGYDELPYQTRWKVFWDSYNISIRYGGSLVKADNTAQSDRATCYKTVSCKFL